MCFITTLFFAITATVLRYVVKNKYKLGFLSLMLWGATIMILIDRVLTYDGGPFLEFETEGLVTNASLLGVWMFIPVFIAWLVSLAVSKFQKQKSRKTTN
jgi:membrane-anchored protein YejM (alkaline phosphatase superfamily)